MVGGRAVFLADDGEAATRTLRHVTCQSNGLNVHIITDNTAAVTTAPLRLQHTWLWERCSFLADDDAREDLVAEATDCPLAFLLFKIMS